MTSPIRWLLTAAVIVTVYAIMFWYVVFVVVGWNMLKIPMGLGGAIYPRLFLPPLLGSLLVYYISYFFLVARKREPKKKDPLTTVFIPIVLTSVFLVVFCPMDGPTSFFSALLSRVK